jgi:hypothetical protein
VRSSTYSVPPAQSGSVGSGSDGAPGRDADVHRVATVEFRTRWTASRTASSKPSRPSGGSGTYSVMSCSRQTTVLRRDSTSGRAIPAGTGVIRPTQWLDSDGLNSGTGRIRRRGSPATAA